MRIATLVLIVGLFSGCVGPPPPKPPFMNDVITAQIVINQTTADEVRKLIGRPQQIDQINEGTTTSIVWTYQFVQIGVNELVPAMQEKYNRPSLRSILRVSFDERRVVRKMERTDRDLRSESEGQIQVPF